MFRKPSPLTSARAALKWFSDQQEKPHPSKDQENRESTNSRNAVARRFGCGDWDDLVRFCDRCAVFAGSSTVRFVRLLPCGVERGWELISDPELLGQWHIPTKMECKVGGRFEFEEAWGGRIGAMESKCLIRFDADAGGTTTFKLTPDHDGLQFLLEDTMAPDLEVPQHVVSTVDRSHSLQPGGPGTHWPGVIAGWHYAADAIETLAGGKGGSQDFDKLADIYSYLIQAHYKSS